MSEKYSQYKANVPRRRTTYKWLIAAVVVVFLVSVADIIWWDEMLQYGIYAAIGILFIWAIVLMFAAVSRNAWDVGEVVLACPKCEHVFLYAADHADNRGHASMTCPVCAFDGELPVSEDQVAEIVMPDGARQEHGYQCSSCEEHILITTIGNAQREVRFDECPHCGEVGTVHSTDLPEEVARRKLDRWTAT